MERKKNRSECPINFAIEIFGDKWTLLIIRDIVFWGKASYGDFLNSEEKISTNILADRLSMLEREGLLNKTRDEQHKSKFIYTLTQKGLDLLPIMLEMVLWGTKYDPNTPVPQMMIDRIKHDKTAFMNEIIDKLKNKERA